MPIDADEFWYVPTGRLRDALDAAAGAGGLEVEVANFVQQRSQDGLAPEALLTMRRRLPDYLQHTWQLRRWRRLAAEGRLEAEWAANSLSR